MFGVFRRKPSSPVGRTVQLYDTRGCMAHIHNDRGVGAIVEYDPAKWVYGGGRPEPYVKIRDPGGVERWIVWRYILRVGRVLVCYDWD